MNRFIEIYGYKNINKKNKPLRFDEWTAQPYFIDPDAVNWVDPIARTIHICDKHTVFKLYDDKAVEQFIKELDKH